MGEYIDMLTRNEPDRVVSDYSSNDILIALAIIEAIKEMEETLLQAIKEGRRW